MRIEVTLPSLGEDEDAVKGGTVALWHAPVGGRVEEGDDLLEVNTDKAAFVVPAPHTGTLLEQRIPEGGAVSVGDILGILEA